MALPLQRTCAETQTIHGIMWVAATSPRTSVCDLRSSPVQTWRKPNKSQGLEGPFVGMTTLPTASLPVAAGISCSCSGVTSRGQGRGLPRSGESTGDDRWLGHGAWGCRSPSTASAP